MDTLIGEGKETPMNIMMEKHLEELAMIEDVDRYWHIPHPVPQEELFENQEAQRSAERNRRRQRPLRRAQQSTAAVLSCVLTG